jgi:hypothetical protein
MTKRDLKGDSPVSIKKMIEELLERKKNEKQALLKVLTFLEGKSGDSNVKDNKH